jgi:hypothetical protein
VVTNIVSSIESSIQAKCEVNKTDITDRVYGETGAGVQILKAGCRDVVAAFDA